MRKTHTTRWFASAALSMGLAFATSTLAQGDHQHDGNHGGQTGAPAARGNGGAPHGGMGGAPRFGGMGAGSRGVGMALARPPQALHSYVQGFGARPQSFGHAARGFSGRAYPYHGQGRHTFSGRGPSVAARGAHGVMAHNAFGPGSRHGALARNAFQHGAQAAATQGGRNYRSAFGGAPGFRPGGARPSYSARYFPRAVTAHVRFHWRQGGWAGPPGWHYRRFLFGELFPLAWCGPGWWIDDYWWYELPVPPWGYAWVRNGPDALLVNVRTGRIVEVVYDVFY